MTAFVRKPAEQPVLREDWHENEDGSRLLLLKYPLLERTGIVEHCFTTRLGGVSTDIFSTMNLSFTRGDEEAAVRENYRRLARALGAEVGQFVCSDQTHTVNVRRVTAADAGKGLTRERDYRDVDGLITDEPGLVLSTFYADCVPLYVVDPVHRAIGMSHSGWRGTAARMGAVTLSAMQEAYGTRPEDVVCAVGPSICKDCYEVSADVADIFAEEFPGHEQEILAESEKNSVGMAHADKKYQLDLWKANELVLTDAGIRPEHMAVTNVCTCCNPELLFSHRASKGKRGNLAAFIALKEG